MKRHTDQFVKMPRDLLESSAWRTLGINARRLLDFLMLEHMRHGGKRNGYLLAPRRQLEKFGIRPASVSPAIAELRNAGIIRYAPGIGRAPSMFTLHGFRSAQRPGSALWGRNRTHKLCELGGVLTYRSEATS